MSVITAVAAHSLKARVWQALDGDWEGGTLLRGIDLFLVALIALNVIVVVVESVPEINAAYGAWFAAFELFSVAVFSLEYVLRVWAAPADPTGIYARPFSGRLRYVFSPMALIDLLAIAPFFLAFLGADLRFLRVLRLLRLLKLTRYFPAMGVLSAVVYNQRRALLSATFVMIVLLVLSASIMYVIEREHQPDEFSSIPAAMWWGIATLTTVGYGDVTPITPLGKLAGAVIAIVGIGMFALPAAILASGFTQEMEKRSFVDSWNLVASLAVFERLPAGAIAEVTELLQPRTAVPGEILFREGDVADSAYFIRTGAVTIRVGSQEFLLGEGDVFGEIALLSNQTRMGSAIAQTSCRLLVLDRIDFDALCQRNQMIRQHFNAIAEQRLAAAQQA